MYAIMLCVSCVAYITRCALVFPFSSILKSDRTIPNKKLNIFSRCIQKGLIFRGTSEFADGILLFDEACLQRT